MIEGDWQTSLVRITSKGYDITVAGTAAPLPIRMSATADFVGVEEKPYPLLSE